MNFINTYLFDLLFVAAEEKKPDIIEAMKFGMLDMVMILNFKLPS